MVFLCFSYGFEVESLSKPIHFQGLNSWQHKRNRMELIGQKNACSCGWALPLWKMMEFVSWDDEIPNWMLESLFFYE